MGGKNLLKKIYDKICRILSLKNLSWMALVIFILLLLPLCYLSFINRATGDDYGYGAGTRAAWLASHSLIQVWKASCQTVKNFYYGWQGTWFSVFLFTLQPEVFNEHAYVAVAFLMLFLWIGSTVFLFREILYKELKLDIWGCRLIAIIFLAVSIEFIPTTRPSIFWYNGTAHYMVPFAMCQVLLVLLLRYGKSYRAGNLVGIAVIMTLLGGSNYQAALFALITAVYTGIISFVKRRDRRIFWLSIPLLLELIGLVISMKAPGNQVRGGENFGFSVVRGLRTIGLSFLWGARDAVKYMKEKPLVYVGLFLIFLILLEASARCKIRGRYFFIPAIALICLYCAMQAPEIYAGVNVSGGVWNTNFQVFMLTTFGILLMIALKVVEKGNFHQEDIHRRLVIPGIVVCLIAVVLFRGTVKTSASYISMEYIATGQAADYKQQMDLQTRLLMDEKWEDVVVPGINDIQGPLMHMPITKDVDNFTNTSARDFYGKKSVVAIPRPEWLEKYGEGQQ